MFFKVINVSASNLIKTSKLTQKLPGFSRNLITLQRKPIIYANK